MELSIFDILRDFTIAFIVGLGWAILFGTPRRILYLAGLIGGMGHSIRFILIQFDLGIITATLAGSVMIGLVGIFAAHKANTPPVVFTMPACITMIPGLFAYRTMLGGIKLTEGIDYISQNPTLLYEIAHNLTLTMSLLFTLAIGITIGALLFRKTNNREITLKEIFRGLKPKKHH